MRTEYTTESELYHFAPMVLKLTRGYLTRSQRREARDTSEKYATSRQQEGEYRNTERLYKDWEGRSRVEVLRHDHAGYTVRGSQCARSPLDGTWSYNTYASICTNNRNCSTLRVLYPGGYNLEYDTGRRRRAGKGRKCEARGRWES